MLDRIREVSSLRSLRVESLVDIASDLDDSSSPCTLPKLENLDLRKCLNFPKLLIAKLDLPGIRGLKLERVESSVKKVDQELKSLVLNVSWLTRIKSIHLEEMPVSEATLLWMLQRLPFLKNLTLTSRERVTCKTTKKLSEQPTSHHGWLCPLLEKVEFGECPRLSESDTMALVEARVRGVPSSTQTSMSSSSLLRKVVWRDQDLVSDDYEIPPQQPMRRQRLQHPGTNQRMVQHHRLVSRLASSTIYKVGNHSCSNKAFCNTSNTPINNHTEVKVLINSRILLLELPGLVLSSTFSRPSLVWAGF
ncbi:hypothetical protein FRB93_011762 [Tulasnella sp. JGI-2019a]|nr:hypothetical protein FRB93_011762 [Tulasnella sp. JGI-2019a]